jgi:O-acetyl-ADP-ribose deacetylase (regulator of RNase III)
VSIEYVTGDATDPQPQGSGVKIIAHVSNDAGGWGRGFTEALSRRFVEPEHYYRRWHRLRKREGFLRSLSRRDDPGHVEVTGDFGLGESQLAGVKAAEVTSNSVSGNVTSLVASGPVFVLNMVAQAGFGPSSEPRLRYPALALCLRHAQSFAEELGASVHMPRIGCGLGRGDWERVAVLVSRLVSVRTFVYDLPPSTV